MSLEGLGSGVLRSSQILEVNEVYRDYGCSNGQPKKTGMVGSGIRKQETKPDEIAFFVKPMWVKDMTLLLCT